MKLNVISEGNELEFKEPEGYFAYQGKDYPYWGNPGGKSKTIEYSVGKFNRFAKLGLIADELTDEFKDILAKDYLTTDGRCSFASLLMMKHGIRIGNEDSAMGYESGLEETEGEIVQTYGTTTLLNKHVSIVKDNINLDFLGKTQVEHNIDIDDPLLIKYARLYYDSNEPEKRWIGIDYDTLFDFVKRKVGKSFIPKDFRTFCANITAWDAIQRILPKPKRETRSEVNEEIKGVVEEVAGRLGNTPSIAKANYVSHDMLDWFKHERLMEEEV